jgi:hypothetical protein
MPAARRIASPAGPTSLRHPWRGMAGSLKLTLIEPQENFQDGIMGFIENLVEFVAPPKAKKLDGTTQATLARSLLALPPEGRGWIRFAEARTLFSTKGAQYAFGEMDQNGRRKIEAFAAQHQSVINFMPVKGRVCFVHNPTAGTTDA